MDDYLKEALEIVKAQAKVRTMAEEEIIAMVQKLADGIREICLDDDAGSAEAVQESVEAPRKAIKEHSILCLECGGSYKVLTQKHLSAHGLNAVEYREKWKFKPGTPLVCKSLQRERRKKMKSMMLWEKRRKNPAP